MLALLQCGGTVFGSAREVLVEILFLAGIVVLGNV